MKRRDPQTRRLLEDPYLEPYRGAIEHRELRVRELAGALVGEGQELLAPACDLHQHLGLHRREDGWELAEWAPNAAQIHLTGSFCDWQLLAEYALEPQAEGGIWRLHLPAEALRHGDLYRLHVRWPGGEGDRIPALARRVVQDERSKIFNAQVWEPDEPYRWRAESPAGRIGFPLIYEAHVGMAQEGEGVGSYDEFRREVLPRVVSAGYNTLQLMAVQEHPYYGSFGYQVSSFFAPTSRCGTPDELKALIDAAHEAGLAVIMDLVHSHAVSNEVEGLSRFDGTLWQYFHDGPRGLHELWDSRLFDYDKHEVVRFLLSNCRYWIEEFRLDGFRFDGITSMLYLHHGLGTAFSSYEQYFDGSVDEGAYAYLALANKLIHELHPAALTIAEDVSGMPGLAAPVDQGGCGFDYRLAMGVADCWFKLVNDTRDEDWSLAWLWHELTNRRGDEQTISYVECHDQALVGGKSLIFELIDAAMYHAMRHQDESLVVERGLALHKMARLLTVATAAHGYLNFMGNEFGHPEWIDFPRDGNGWSYHHARRQWSLRDDPSLRYHSLGDFDGAMLHLVAPQAPGRLRLLRVDDADKILAFERDGLFFFFNFHPNESRSDYALELPPGEYEHVLDTDAKAFGGREHIAQGQRYFTQPEREGNELRNLLRIYLPCRTGLVLRRA